MQTARKFKTFELQDLAVLSNCSLQTEKYFSVLNIPSSCSKLLILWFPLFLQKLIPIGYFVLNNTF